MPAYSKEREKLYMARIRSLLVKRHDLSTVDLVELLKNHPSSPVSLDWKYVNKLVKKIHGEQARRTDAYTVNTAIARFEDEMIELKQRLWAIIADVGEKDEKGKYTRYPPSNKDKIAATKVIIEGTARLFDKMFDAGIFTRKLGKVEVEISSERQKRVREIFEMNNKGIYTQTHEAIRQRNNQ